MTYIKKKNNKVTKHEINKKYKYFLIYYPVNF